MPGSSPPPLQDLRINDLTGTPTKYYCQVALTEKMYPRWNSEFQGKAERLLRAAFKLRGCDMSTFHMPNPEYQDSYVNDEGMRIPPMWVINATAQRSDVAL